MILSTHEAAAHLRILDAIAQVQELKIGEYECYMRVCPELEAFAPRCNCGSVLSFRRHGRRLASVSCKACGHKHLEAR